MTINGDLDSNGALDVARGGTNGTTAEQARTNLDVYSKDEVNARITPPVSITFTLSGDTDVTDPYSLVWASTVLRIVHGYGINYLPALTIMDAGGVKFDPPVVTWVDSNTIDIDFGITIPIGEEWVLAVFER